MRKSSKIKYCRMIKVFIVKKTPSYYFCLLLLTIFCFFVTSFAHFSLNLTINLLDYFSFFTLFHLFLLFYSFAASSAQFSALTHFSLFSCSKLQRLVELISEVGSKSLVLAD